MISVRYIKLVYLEYFAFLLFFADTENGRAQQLNVTFNHFFPFRIASLSIIATTTCQLKM